MSVASIHTLHTLLANVLVQSQHNDRTGQDSFINPTRHPRSMWAFDVYRLRCLITLNYSNANEVINFENLTASYVVKDDRGDARARTLTHDPTHPTGMCDVSQCWFFLLFPRRNIDPAQTYRVAVNYYQILTLPLQNISDADEMENACCWTWRTYINNRELNCNTINQSCVATCPFL